MAEKAILLGDLAPEVALELLTTTAPTLSEPERAAILASVWMVAGDGAQTTLVLRPEAARQAPRRTVDALHEALVQRYETQKGAGAAASGAVPPGALPLATGAAALLMQSRGRAVAPDPVNFLVVGFGLQQDGAQAVYDELAAFVTQERVAAAQAVRSDGSVDPYWLFAVRSDPDRAGDFTAWLAGAAFANCVALACYTDRGSRVYLPLPFAQDALNPQRAPIGPDLLVFNRFLQLVRLAPQAFGLTQTTGEHLLAIVRMAPNALLQAYRLLPLADLEFRSLAHRRAAGESTFQLVELTANPATLERLQRQIEQVEPPLGHRLRLVRDRRSASHAEATERLRVQLARLEQELAYHINMGYSRPRLLRFTQPQLPALVDFLRTAPRRLLRDGQIRYAFAAVRRHAGGAGRPGYATAADFAEGLHFLFLEPEATVLDDALLAAWESRHAPTLRFWLDPFWARTYHTVSECLVFTPKYSALMPSLHSWEVEDMDRYLRWVLPLWFPDALPEGKVLARRPIYLFDGRADSTQPIAVTILDADAFTPLAAQVGWLNDNLLLQETLPMETIVTQLAEAGARTRLAEAVERQAASALSSLDQSAAALAADLAQRVGEITSGLTEELQRLFATSEATVQQIQQLDAQLNKDRAIYAQMAGLHAESERLLAALLQAQSDVDERIRTLESQLQGKLREAETVRVRAERRIGETVRKLEQTRELLQERIDHL